MTRLILPRRSFIKGAAALAAYAHLRPTEASARAVVNQLTGFGAKAPAAGGLSFAFQNSAQSTTGTASLDFTSFDIGAADAGLVGIVGVAMGNANANTTNISAVTVDGNSATVRARAERDSTSTILAEATIWTVALPSSSGSVTINVTASAALNTNFNYRAIFFYRMIGGTETPSDTLVANSTNNPSGTIDVQAGGAAMGVGSYIEGTGSDETGGSASNTYSTLQTGITIDYSGDAAGLAWTELVEDAQEDFAEGVSGSDRAAMAVAAFDAA